MERLLYDSTREGLLKLWSEIQENPNSRASRFTKEVWDKLTELDKIIAEDRLADLRQELGSDEIQTPFE